MTTRSVALAAFWSLAPAALAAPGLLPAALDDTTKAASDDDPMVWARRVVALRQSVEAAEAEPAAARRAALAADALAAAEALTAQPGAAASVRPLLLRAQALVEAAQGPIARELAADEVRALRGPALAALGSTFEPVLPERISAEVRAEAARAEGPAILFYPAEAVPFVEAERAAAARLARAGRRHRRTLSRLDRALRRRGVPAQLRYVAVIESALNRHAQSWAGAEGLWQFMPATAREYGLTSRTVHQEGPSTAAAARYLRWLAGRFDGDWHLALAAYNCGVGRVERVVRNARAELGRQPTFWDIRADLPRETQHYVPRFLAVAEALGG